MPYKERLNPWVLVRLLPKMQRVTVAHYRSRSDADGHLHALRRLMPNAKFVVIFNPGLPQE
ncbi:MAG TPA: hypothetical protein DEG47_11075 [Cyanobacteria bacterium UBA11148]|nr:hypothetical protein [Cyanobacteria bacterium UBA11148]